MTTTQKKLTENQREDLARAAQHPHGLYSPPRGNRRVASMLRHRKLLVEGPAVPESERASVVAEALASLRLAAQRAEAGEFYEAESEASDARRTFARLTDEADYITEAGREAAASGFYVERD